MTLSLVIFAASLVILIMASNSFIDAAEKIGLSFGISPFIIGVTIVALGTSLPELATSIISVVEGSSEIVVGNVVGSNITNILLVLGISAMFSGKLVFERDIMEDDLPLLLGSVILLYFFLNDLHFSILESIIFMFGLGGFLWYSIKEKGEPSEMVVPFRWFTIVKLLLSGVGVYIGAKFTVVAIGDISGYLGVNPAVVSLSILAFGTSLPEIVVSIAACRKGLHSMVLGNILGSNIFNTYGVMAIPSFFGELVIPESIMTFSIPFMIAVTIIFGLVCYSKKVSFWEAGMLVSFYIFFLGELIRIGFVNGS